MPFEPAAYGDSIEGYERFLKETRGRSDAKQAIWEAKQRLAQLRADKGRKPSPGKVA